MHKMIKNIDILVDANGKKQLVIKNEKNQNKITIEDKTLLSDNSHFYLKIP